MIISVLLKYLVRIKRHGREVMDWRAQRIKTYKSRRERRWGGTYALHVRLIWGQSKAKVGAY